MEAFKIFLQSRECVQELLSRAEAEQAKLVEDKRLAASGTQPGFLLALGLAKSCGDIVSLKEKDFISVFQMKLYHFLLLFCVLRVTVYFLSLGNRRTVWLRKMPKSMN